MSSGKLPSAISIAPLNHQPRGLGHSIPNDSLSKKPEPLTLPPTPGSAGSQGYQHNTHYSYGSENTGYMNSQGNSYGAMDYGHHHHSQGQPPTPQTATSTFPSQPTLLQPTYQQPSHGFPQFPFSNPNGVSSPAGQPGVSGPMSMHPTQQLLPPPQGSMMSGGHPSLGPSPHGGPPTPTQGYGTHTFDTTGQQAPPGMKPRVAATLWEDEGSLCFQVEARGVCVARREDNHMINGTKLLNVAGMTRGRRDGILKSEKIRHVVKIGPMHLKGVWIPFERALDFANKEKITELLYPLFVHNIGSFLYHPANTQRTNAVMAAAAERRRGDGNVLPLSPALSLGPPLPTRSMSTDLIPASQPGQMHSMHNPINSHLPPHSNLGPPRPEMQRSISFPTPPSSASSVMGVGSSDGQSYWGANMVSNVPGSGNQGLAIETVMNSTSRSLPTTPATTPPGGLQQMQQYGSSSMYQNGPGAMQQQQQQQQNMQQQRYQPIQQTSQYLPQQRDVKNMGPPATQGRPGDRPSSRDDEPHIKEDNDGQNGGAGAHGQEDQEGEQVQDVEYTTHDGSYANGHGRQGVYYPPLQTEHSHMSSENNMTGSPNQGAPSTPGSRTYGTSTVSVPRAGENGTGATPRTTTTPQQQWAQGPGGYATPPRGPANGGPVRQPPSRPLTYDGTENPGTNGNPSDGSYSTQPGLGVSMSSQPGAQSYNGVNGTAKRIRDMDEEEDHGSRPPSRQDDRSGETEGGMKRRKTITRENSNPTTGMGPTTFDRNADGRLNRTRSAVSVNARPVGRR